LWCAQARDSLEAALLKLTLQVIAGSGTLQARSTVTHKLLPSFCDPAAALASATDAAVRSENLKVLLGSSPSQFRLAHQFARVACAAVV
jgi:hypothetical protein